MYFIILYMYRIYHLPSHQVLIQPKGETYLSVQLTSIKIDLLVQKGSNAVTLYNI